MAMIGIAAGVALLLLLSFLAVVKATRAALGASPAGRVDSVHAASMSTAVSPVVPVRVPANDVQPNSIKADVLPILSVPQPTEAPAAGTLMITLWRGYGKSRFVARSGHEGPIVAASKAFRWRATETVQPDAVIRAHAELLARLAKAGWRSVEYAESDPWYRVDLQRGSKTELAPSQEPAAELSTPLPTTP